MSAFEYDDSWRKVDGHGSFTTVALNDRGGAGGRPEDPYDRLVVRLVTGRDEDGRWHWALRPESPHLTGLTFQGRADDEEAAKAKAVAAAMRLHQSLCNDDSIGPRISELLRFVEDRPEVHTTTESLSRAARETTRKAPL